MIRLKESFERAKEKGLVNRKSELARAIWPESSPKAAYMNYINLEKGKSERMPISAVPLLCNKLKVSADYLFGRTEDPTPEEYRSSVREKAQEIISIAETL